MVTRSERAVVGQRLERGSANAALVESGLAQPLVRPLASASCEMS